MYKVSVPAILTSANYDREKLLENLNKAGADRVMLALYRVLKNGRIQTEENMDRLAEELAFFQNQGFETCVWIGETIGHGWPINEGAEYSNIVNILGNPGYAAFCPTDEKFVADICKWIANVARAGAKQILLDDDFRMTNHGAAGSSACCLCERHLQLYRAAVGEDLSREEIKEKVFTGGPSVYRDAWVNMMRETMLGFAEKIRAAVDEVDESVRIGVCGTASMMDADGECFADAAKILAGRNNGLIRMFGAPYWAHNGFDLANVITMERRCAAGADHSAFEVICEGDTWPRPRFACPSAYLEIFDQALAADGGFDGILKYMIEYDAPYDYETGYIDEHVKNRPLLKKIQKEFGGDCAGIRLFERYERFRGADLSGDALDNAELSVWRPQGIGCRFVSALGLPVAFEGNGPVVVFGENAKYIEAEALKAGAIIDLPAARYLQARGIDVGLKSENAATDVISREHFLAEDVHITTAHPLYADLAVKEGAEVLSYLEGKERHVGAYRYLNADGMRFLVYAFDGERSDARVYRNYARQREVAGQVEWLSGEKLPASCTGHPDTYMICKKIGEKLAVGFWNLFPDKIAEAAIGLSRNYSSVRWIAGRGELKEDGIHIKDVAPYAFVGFVLGEKDE